MTTLHGTTFTLRPWRDTDIPSLVKYANNRAISRNMRNIFPYPYTQKDAEWWIQTRKEDTSDNLFFAIEVDGEAVGGISCRVLEDVYFKGAEIGYWIGEPFWGRGIMSEVASLFTDAAFARLDIVRIEALVFGWNARSARVLENSGYHFEGRLERSVCKDGELTDQLVYARFRS